VTAESFGIERSDRLAGRTADDNGVSAVGQGRKVDPQEAASKGEFWDAIIDSGDVGVGGGDVGSKKSMFFGGASKLPMDLVESGQSLFRVFWLCSSGSSRRQEREGQGAGTYLVHPRA
jgi:hypothetical protein